MSRAFVDRYVTDHDDLATLIPGEAGDGVDFAPSHPKAEEALAWMGLEVRSGILELLDKAMTA